MTQVYRAYAPASAANLSVGFDLLGAALKPVDGKILGDEIFIKEGTYGSGCILRQSGHYASKLPADPKKNIVYRAYELYALEMQRQGRALLDVEIELRKNLPVCSGLGSSAASVVAGVLAIDAVHGSVLGESGQLDLMGALEGEISGSVHYDNVAPCFFGGLQLIVGEGGIISRTLPDFENWLWVSCFPGIKISTNQARSILPKQYERAVTINFGRRLAAFVDACHRGDDKLAGTLLTDVIAEPYRASLIPGFEDARRYGAGHGALATGISGSGSAIFSVYEDEVAALEAKEWLERNFIANEDGFCHVCKIDRRGAYVEKV
ncbi:MAG: homoserine kinase [Succinivibrio sp.]|nr:homoserine kinase [Succinivibrio sp.]